MIMCRFVIVLLFSMSVIVFHAMESMENIQENMKALALDEHKQEQSRVPALKELCLHALVNILGNKAQEPDIVENNLTKLPEELYQKLYTYSEQPMLREDLRGLRSIKGDRAIVDGIWQNCFIKMCSFNAQKVLWSYIKDVRNNGTIDGSNLYQVCFSFDSRYIAVSNYDYISIYAADTGEIIAKIAGFYKYGEFYFDKDNNLLYLNDRQLKKYSMVEQKSYDMRDDVYRLKAYLVATDTVLVRRDNKYDYDIIDEGNGDVIKTIPFGSFDVSPAYYAVCSNVSGCERLATVSYAELNKVCVWDLTMPSPAIIATFNIFDVSLLTALCFDNTGNKIIVGTEIDDHSVYLWDISQPQPVLLVRYVLPHKSRIIQLWWHNDEIVTSSINGHIYCIRLLLAQKIKQYIENKKQVGSTKALE